MTKPQIQHLKLKNTELDPYQLFKNKSNRMSWNRLLETESFIDKEAMIDWFSQLKDYSEETVKAIIIDGLLENEFHKVTFILQLAMTDDFKTLSSKQVFTILYNFVVNTPKGVLSWIDEQDFAMSRDVLALLSRN